MNELDKRYRRIIIDILNNGNEKIGRNGLTKSTFVQHIRHDMSSGFPLLTLRPIYLRIAVEEMLFFFRGETDTKKLEEKNINIWKGNTTREFLDNRGLNHLPEGDMGKGYGWQIRNFGGTAINNGYDQLSELVFNLKNNPHSRRHIISHWNPLQLDDSALPPCHLYQQYYINDNKLSLMVLLRSWDFYHGAPYNISGYGFILTAMAKLLNLDVGELIIQGNDVHLYESQFEVADKLSNRNVISALPDIKIHKEINILDDLLSIEFNTDVEIIGYRPQDKLEKIPMVS